MPTPHAFRYPGAKTKLADLIIPKFPPYFWGTPLLSSAAAGVEYREPFFGSGAIGLRILYELPPNTKAWINDADPGVANYWKAVVYHPDDLIARVLGCRPTVELYREYLRRTKDETLDLVTSGFITLFLHQCSYSGLGKKAGSPIGGWDQADKTYTIGCRWHEKALARDIRKSYEMLSCLALKITCLDFAAVFEGIESPEQTFFYCDPPYVKRGPELYAESMTADDHVRLSDLLHELKSPWVLSYDADPLVRHLYADCLIEPISARYTVTNGIPRGKLGPSGTTEELLITPKPVPLGIWKNGYMVDMNTGLKFTELSKSSGVPADVIRNRIRRGWTLERALTEPPRLRRGS